MSHNFIQPDEINYILMAMADHNVKVDTPIPDRTQLSGTIRDTERYELAMPHIDHIVVRW